MCALLVCLGVKRDRKGRTKITFVGEGVKQLSKSSVPLQQTALQRSPSLMWSLPLLSHTRSISVLVVLVCSLIPQGFIELLLILARCRNKS